MVEQLRALTENTLHVEVLAAFAPRGPHEKIGRHFANGRASQAISRAGRLEKSVLSAVTGDEKAISRDL